MKIHLIRSQIQIMIVSIIKKYNKYIELKENKQEINNENNIQNQAQEQVDNKENEENNNEEKKEEEKKEEEKNENNPENNNENNNNEENKEEEQIMKILDSNRRITSDEVRETPILIIEEKDCNLFNGEQIKINAAGMIGGGREVGDGLTIFGSSANKENDSINNNEAPKLKADFILNLKDKYSYPYIFMIYFEKDTKSYYIRPYSGKNNDNRILYIKLGKGYNLPLKQKEIISAGNIFFQVTPVDNNHLEIVNLSKQSLSLVPKQTFDASSKKEVTIGRNKDCDFSFPNNKSFSRTQTTFEYDEENQEWIIMDGSRVRSSTNGTWVFCTHSFVIKDKMIVEVMNNIIQISEESKNE